MDNAAAYYRHFGTPPRLARKLRAVRHAAPLLEIVIAELRRRGIKIQEVAKVIGITPTCLSRALKTHDMELSTFLLLIEAAGLSAELNALATPATEEAISILNLLREHESTIRAAGADAVAIFGSVASGAAKATSDIDILISTQVSVAEYDKIYEVIAKAIQRPSSRHITRPIDFAVREKLQPGIALQIKRTAIYAF